MKTRNAYIDNSKLILIFLVVLGHIIQFASPKDQLIKAVFVFIYLFHMPAFILLSGYLSRNLKKAPKRLIKYVLLYIVFELLYYIIIGNMRDFLLTPYVHLWFLLSLFWWNLLLFGFSRLKAWIALPSAVIIGLIAGCFDFIDLPLSLSRTFYFFPCFLAGYYIPESFKKEINLKTKLIASAVLAVIFILTLLFWDYSTDWVLGKSGYAALQVSNLGGIALRAGMYLVSTLCTLCFFVLVPKKKSRLSYLGSNTMTVYTLHYFPVYYAAMLRLIYTTAPPFTYLIILVVSIIVTVLLGLIPMQRLISYIASMFAKLSQKENAK